ncbi:hypothetical protein JCM3765_002405 [Sporobolomyces pararoseus]
MSLLSLPPEILHKIFSYHLETPIWTYHALILTRVHSSLTRIARDFLFRDLVLYSERGIVRLLDHSPFKNWTGQTRRLVIDGWERVVDSYGPYELFKMRGIGVWKVLNVIEEQQGHWERQDGLGGLREVVLKGCQAIDSDLFFHSALKNVKHLILGGSKLKTHPNFDIDEPSSFQLETLTILGNGKYAVPIEMLQFIFFSSCQGSLKILDLSQVSYPESLFRALCDHSSDEEEEEDDDSDKEREFIRYFDSVQELYAPPMSFFDDHKQLAIIDAVTSRGPSPFPYVEMNELPLAEYKQRPFGSWSKLENLRIVEMGLVGDPSSGILSTVQGFLKTLGGEWPESVRRGKRETGLERIRLIDPEWISRSSEESVSQCHGQIADLAREWGVELVYGKYERPNQQRRGET